MTIKRRIIFLVLTLFLEGVAFSQDVKQQTTPAPRVCFGKFMLDSINITSSREILIADSLFLIKGKEQEMGRVASFDIYTLKDDIGFIESVYGNRLSKKQRLLISSALPGQKIYFQNIKVKHTGKEKVKLNSRFIFKIKS